MNVFRIETATGCGACQSSGLCQKYHTVCETPCLDYGFTDEGQVAERMFGEGWKFAFPSMDRLKAWFPDQKGREVMKASTAHIVEYETTDEIEGNRGTQVLFNFPKAKRVAEYDVVTLAKIEEPTHG